MSQTRRDFVKAATIGAVAIAASDRIAELIAQSPQGKVLESKFKGLSDLVLAEAKRLGCTYADVRFTRNFNGGGVNANGNAGGGRGGAGGGGAFPGGGGGRGGGRGGGGRGGGGGFGGFGGGFGDGADDATPGAAGFGIRVIHSGVWGFASSPIVTEDELKRITAMAVTVAKASAIAKKRDVQLCPVPAYQVNWNTPLVKDPRTMSQTDKQAYAQSIVDKVMANKEVTNCTVNLQFNGEWKYFASSEGSYIEQELMTTQPSLSVTAAKNGVTKTRSYPGIPGMGGWEIIEKCGLMEGAEKAAIDAVEMCTAAPLTPGVKDVILLPSHTMLTVHEIVAHATELDRIMGYEANYAGTSFVKLADIGKLKYGSKLFNITADKTRPTALATIGYDDDGVKTREFPIVREGILVGLSANREMAHYLGEKESRGCTQASGWSQYPFMRMPNVHMDPDPKGPSLEEIIADTKDGVMIDGRGSYSIDQQRYNGQFGGDCFWEIKNGKVTRQLANVTYNAITTDFWGSLDAVGNPSTFKMFGTGGDAKGQPTQTQNISHGAPACRIRKLMLGGAFQ